MYIWANDIVIVVTNRKTLLCFLGRLIDVQSRPHISVRIRVSVRSGPARVRISVSARVRVPVRLGVRIMVRVLDSVGDSVRVRVRDTVTIRVTDIVASRIHLHSFPVA